jgi:hypothetical protein
MTGPASRVVKTEPSDFLGSGQYFYGRKLIQPITQDTVAA